jgi:hypothetical protein
VVYEEAVEQSAGAVGLGAVRDYGHAGMRLADFVHIA